MYLYILNIKRLDWHFLSNNSLLKTQKLFKKIKKHFRFFKYFLLIVWRNPRIRKYHTFPYRGGKVRFTPPPLAWKRDPSKRFSKCTWMVSWLLARRWYYYFGQELLLRSCEVPMRTLAVVARKIGLPPQKDWTVTGRDLPTMPGGQWNLWA